MRWALLGGALLVAGCARAPDTLELYYSDEIVDAPTRTVEVAIVRAESCDALLAKRYDQVGEADGLVFRRSTSYPVNPEAKVLDGVPRGVPVAVDAAGYDENNQRISRACSVQTFADGQPLKVSMELRALPACATQATALDVMLVVDTSMAMAIHDPAGKHLTSLNDTVLDPMQVRANTMWGIVTYGTMDAPQEFLAATTELTAVKGAITSLSRSQGGKPKLFDGMVKAAGLLRARAVCGKRPAMVIIASESDDGSKAPFEQARVGLYATRGDSTDDIFTFAVALTEDGYDDLDELVPEEVGKVTGAGTEPQIEAAMKEVRDALLSLVH